MKPTKPRTPYPSTRTRAQPIRRAQVKKNKSTKQFVPFNYNGSIIWRDKKVAKNEKSIPRVRLLAFRLLNEFS